MSVNSGEMIYRAAIASYINPVYEARLEADAVTMGATISLDANGLPLSPVGRIEKYFAYLDSENVQKVTAQDLAKAWKSHLVNPSGNDLELIAREIDRFMKVADLDGDGFVSLSEYTHYMLTLIKEHEEGKRLEIHGVLADNATKDPKLVDKLLELFRTKDVVGNGEISIEEFKQIISLVDLKEKKRVQILDSVGRQNLNRITYSEYVLLMLGKIPTEVSLISYDISGKATKKLSRILFGKKIDGIWHTSILAFGFEWWYGGDCFQSRPCSTPFGPSPTRTEPLGNTTRSIFELKEFIRSKMRKKYNYDSYDVMTNNCNNFTNEISNFLIHKGIRKEIVSLPSDLLAGGVARLMRPFLNKWLGNFKGTETDHSCVGNDPDVLKTIRDEKTRDRTDFQKGDIAVWKRSDTELIYCEILQIQKNGKIKIKIFKNLQFKIKLILNKSYLTKISTQDLNANETSINYLIALSILENEKSATNKSLMKQITMGLIDGLVCDQHRYTDPNANHISMIADGGISDDDDPEMTQPNCCKHCLLKYCSRFFHN